MSSSEGRPFLWFGCADGTLSKQEVATPRMRLARELQSIINYMAQCDLEKANEPIVVLFSRLSPDVIRSGAALPTNNGSPKDSQSGMPLGDDISMAEYSRVKALRRAIEEARDKLNPRFIMLIPLQQPWLWTFVFLRGHDQLRPALHRLAPNAAQLMADRRQAVTPGLLMLDDLTAGKDVLQRLRPRMAHELRPLLLWMGENMEDSNERVVVLCICAEWSILAQRFIIPDADSGEAYQVAGLSDLGDAEFQRTLLARDRLFNVVDVLQPRLLVLVNWLTNSDDWLMVVCRDQTRLITGIGNTLPNREFCIWAQRRLPQPSKSGIYDVCYSNVCPKRGQVQLVQLCPRCFTAKYCSSMCQAEHWKAGHCRFCSPLQAAKLKRGPGARNDTAKVRSPAPSVKKR
ncbi:hypothetical protein Vretimale_12324 [Volvox reticuliferus]|uniref:MYND-type domain-containing protein n=1 Tax=Volvox reticuliferus TaxID=1737510 RepID=A0A8J4FNP2_9CHLO|nr:hypothetical protein Vretifemale_8884 [Volvox reticuliferus]GIM08242.1 hypothetical protein Vretimale_12324 [Volvox reticuliferus]